MTMRSTLFAVGIALCAGPVLSQDRTALVIANTGYGGAADLSAIRRSTEDMSETLFGLGFTVERLENASQAAIYSAIVALDGPAVIYYAGHGFASDGVSYLLPVAAPVSDAPAMTAEAVPVADMLQPGRIVFLDTCHGPASQGIPGAGALAEGLGEGVDDLLVISPVPPGMPCPAEAGASLTGELLDRLQVPGLPSTELLSADGEAGGFHARSTQVAPFVFRPVTSEARLTREDYAVLESLSPSARGPLLALWEQAGIVVDFEGEVGQATGTTQIGQVENETVVLTAPLRPVAAASVAPVSLAAGRVGTVGESVSILNVAPQASVAARPVPGAGGLPRPSIIVGFPEEVVTARFDVATDDPVGEIGRNEVSYENVALRREFAENNRELYLSLVESGAFDPPVAQMAVALQTELQRMNCYTNAIDGDWGRGSQASVGRYYAQIGGTAPTQEPTLEIWRQLMLRDDVRCPDVVVAQPAPTQQAAPARQPQRAAPAAQAPRQQQAAPQRAAPAPAAPAPRRTISTTSGTGVFR